MNDVAYSSDDPEGVLAVARAATMATVPVDCPPFGCQVNAVDPGLVFKRYAEAGFLYPAKLDRLAPVLPIVTDNLASGHGRRAPTHRHVRGFRAGHMGVELDVGSHPHQRVYPTSRGAGGPSGIAAW